MADGVQGDPGGAHHGVPDQTLVPHLHDETQVQTVDLTGGHTNNWLYVAGQVETPLEVLWRTSIAFIN